MDAAALRKCPLQMLDHLGIVLAVRALLTNVCDRQKKS